MAWNMVSVTVSLDPLDDKQVVFTIDGVESFTIPRERVSELAHGDGKSIDALIAYIAITAARSGADLSTLAKAKQYIEGRQWPW